MVLLISIGVRLAVVESTETPFKRRILTKHQKAPLFQKAVLDIKPSSHAMSVSINGVRFCARIPFVLLAVPLQPNSAVQHDSSFGSVPRVLAGKALSP